MSRTSPRTLGLIAALLIVAGAVVVLTTPPQSFGWFAYAPLSDAVYTGPGRFSLPTLLSGRQLLGLVTVGIGLVLAGVAVGIRLGQRPTR